MVIFKQGARRHPALMRYGHWDIKRIIICTRLYPLRVVGFSCPAPRKHATMLELYLLAVFHKFAYTFGICSGPHTLPYRDFQLPLFLLQVKILDEQAK